MHCAAVQPLNSLYSNGSWYVLIALQNSGKWAIHTIWASLYAKKNGPKNTIAKRIGTGWKQRILSPMSNMKINQFNCNFVADSVKYLNCMKWTYTWRVCVCVCTYLNYLSAFNFYCHHNHRHRPKRRWRWKRKKNIRIRFGHSFNCIQKN